MVSDQELSEFNFILKSYTKYDLSDYSEKSLKRRIEKILEDYKINFKALLFKIKSDEEFTENLIKDITVNTTELFRDPVSWHAIKYKILPKLADKENINIWHAGCSTGQEVYSMLILLKETGLYDKANVFASDINSDVIEFAKKGEYKYRFNLNYLDNFDEVIKKNPFNFEEYKDVPYEKYFSINKSKDTIVINEELRSKPIWKVADLVKKQNPFSVNYDIVLCRNVLIYFNISLQNEVVKFFHSQMNEKSYLILGIHESIFGVNEQYFKKRGKYYIRLNTDN